MKHLILVALLAFSGCSTFKQKVVEKTTAAVKTGAKKYLKCSTGDAAAHDVEKLLNKFLKTDGGGQEDAKSIGEDVCVYGTGLVLPLLVDLGNKKLPETWKADGCTLENAGEDLKELSKKLCGLIP